MLAEPEFIDTRIYLPQRTENMNKTLSSIIRICHERESRKGPYPLRELIADLTRSSHRAVGDWMRGKPTSFVNQYILALIFEALGYKVRVLDLVKNRSQPAKLDAMPKTQEQLGFLIASGIVSMNELTSLLDYGSNAKVIDLISGSRSILVKQFDDVRRGLIEELVVEKSADLAIWRQQLEARMTPFVEDYGPGTMRGPAPLVEKPRTTRSEAKARAVMRDKIRGTGEGEVARPTLPVPVAKQLVEDMARSIRTLFLHLPHFTNQVNGESRELRDLRQALNTSAGAGVIPQVAVMLRKLSSETALQESNHEEQS